MNPRTKPYIPPPKDYPEHHQVFRLVAPWKLKGWRFTHRTLGCIPGVRANLTIIATDGNLGVFLDSNGTPFLGHVQVKEGSKILQQGFDGKVEALDGKAKTKSSTKSKSTKSKPKVSKLQLRVLQELQELDVELTPHQLSLLQQ